MGVIGLHIRKKIEKLREVCRKAGASRKIRKKNRAFIYPASGLKSAILPMGLVVMFRTSMLKIDKSPTFSAILIFYQSFKSARKRCTSRENMRGYRIHVVLYHKELLCWDISVPTPPGPLYYRDICIPPVN